MPYGTHWMRLERWVITQVDYTVLTTMDMIVGEHVRFEGSGVKTDPKSVVIRIDTSLNETTWANQLQFTALTPEEAEVQHSGLGKFTIIRSSRVLGPPLVPAKMRCYLGDGPTGLAWTAEEVLPPP